MNEITPEEWRPVPDYGDLYEVSNHGQVWSAPRTRTRGGLLKATPNKESRYLYVSLSCDGIVSKFTVQQLVMLAFAGPCPEGKQIRHLDGNPANNRWAPGDEQETRAAGGNLVYGTQSENEYDKVAHGTHQKASLTQCANGHDWTEENIELSYYPDGRIRQRVCKKCRPEYRRRTRERRAQSPERCTEDGCEGPILARKMCGKHYRIWYLDQPGARERVNARRRRTDKRKRSEKMQGPQ